MMAYFISNFIGMHQPVGDILLVGVFILLCDFLYKHGGKKDTTYIPNKQIDGGLTRTPKNDIYLHINYLTKFD